MIPLIKILENPHSSMEAGNRAVTSGRDQGQVCKGQEETLGDDLCVHYLDGGDGFTGTAYINQNLSTVRFKYVQSVYQLSINKAVCLRN